MSMSQDSPAAPAPDAPAEADDAAPGEAPTRNSESDVSHKTIPTFSTAVISEGEVLAERYRVFHRLGKGGMGEVYLAQHIAIGRMVAIKTLSAEMQGHPELAHRFLKEARTSSQVRHPNVVDILDFGHTERGTAFFVMEYLEGEDLKTVLKRERILPWDRTCALVTQVCAALAAAHHHGVIHRDLKPDNIHVLQQDGREVVKVLDFGIAKVISADGVPEVTRTGVLLGTPEYMSPEQARDEDLDARSDIYACGVLLYRMLAGRLPFRARNFMSVLAMQMQDAPVPPRQLDPPTLITEAQEAVILRCLAKSPRDRFQSAEALAQAMRDASHAAPPLVVAPPPHRTRPWGVIAGVAGLLVLAAIAIFAVNAARDRSPPASQLAAAATPPVIAAPPVTAAPSPPVQPPPAPPPVIAAPPAITTPPEPGPQPVPEDIPELAAPTPGKSAPRKRPSAATPSGPLAALGTAEIQAAIAEIRGALAPCSEFGIPGTTIRVSATVSPEGKVLEATAPSSVAGSELGDCVEKAARQLRFPALAQAQRVTLPLRL